METLAMTILLSGILFISFLVILSMVDDNRAYLYGQDGSASRTTAFMLPIVLLLLALLGTGTFLLLVIAFTLETRVVFLLIEALVTRDKERMKNVVDNHIRKGLSSLSINIKAYLGGK